MRSAWISGRTAGPTFRHSYSRGAITEKRPPEKGFARNRKLVIGAVTRGALSLRGDETCESIGPWSRQPAGVSLPQPSVDFERCNQSTLEPLSPLVELGVIMKGATMKYVVADSRGRILKVDASRCSEAVNWARNRLSGAPSVSKVPEVLKVVGDDPDQVLLVADEETAKVDGWWKGPAGRLQHAR